MDPEIDVENNTLELIGLRVADHVSAMLAYWDKDLVCRFANAAYIDWFGKTREEMVGKVTLMELLGPLYEKNKPYILGALEGKVQTFERAIPVPSGGIRHSLANYFPDIVDGEVKGFFVHVADITQVKLLENELVRSNELIKDQNKRLLNFSNIVSHNLRSYANNLKSILDFLVKAESNDERDLMLGYLQGISKGFSSTVKNLSNIVDVQNHSDLPLEAVNLHNCIEQSVEILQVELKSCNAVVQNNVSESVTMTANPAYLESIFLNLFTNALKYRHPDRIPVISIDACLSEKVLKLKVTDNGLGIDLTKHKQDVFGMYKTFHGNPDAKGVGLYLAKLQVEMMGGDIDLESKVNEGTVFTLRFPIH